MFSFGGRRERNFTSLQHEAGVRELCGFASYSVGALWLTRLKKDGVVVREQGLALVVFFLAFFVFLSIISIINK